MTLRTHLRPQRPLAPTQRTHRQVTQVERLGILRRQGIRWGFNSSSTGQAGGDCLAGTCHRVRPGDTTIEVTKRRTSHLIAMTSGSQCPSPLPALTAPCDFPDARTPNTSPRRTHRLATPHERLDILRRARGSREGQRLGEGPLIVSCVSLLSRVVVVGGRGGWDERSGQEAGTLSGFIKAPLDPISTTPAVA